MQPQPTTSQPARIIELASFDAAFAIAPEHESAMRRRFMTLIVEGPHAREHPVPGQNAGQGEVLRATNTVGEHIALKRLRPLPSDADPWSRKGREAALFEEYRNHLAVAQLKGFPRLYGFGITREGEPVILMEWIEGMTLYDALPLLPRAKASDGSASGLTAETVAAIGIPLWSALASTSVLEGTFAHRDISLRNIMLNGMRGPVSSPAALDPCLIDLGSSIFLGRDYASFTMTTDVWRYATPDYAPPEMLAPRDASFLEKRCSPAVDVYALCSVLYHLYAGHTPFELGGRVEIQHGKTAYDIKEHEDPAPLAPRRAEDAGLADAIMSGLARSQAARPSADEMLERFLSWQDGEQVERGGAGGQRAECEETGGKQAIDIDSEQRPDSVGNERRPDPVGETMPVPAGDKQQSIPTDDAVPIGGAAKTGKTDIIGKTDTHRASFSRRTAVKAAACTAGALALGGVAWATRGFGLLATPSFDNRDWKDVVDLAQQISRASDDRAALSIARKADLLDGDGNLRDDLVHDIALSSGTVAQVRVVDFYHDELADGSGRAGLTFAFTQPITRRAMASSPMASGGWEQSELRSWLGNELLAQLPPELADSVATVSKLTNNVGVATSASDVTATKDRLWLFSIAELGGERDPATMGAGYQYLAEIQNAEGSQYRLWKQAGVSSNSENSALKRRFNGAPCYWWVRSCSSDTSANAGEIYFNRVGPNGDPFHFATSATSKADVNTVLPGFCL